MGWAENDVGELTRVEETAVVLEVQRGDWQRIGSVGPDEPCAVATFTASPDIYIWGFRAGAPGVWRPAWTLGVVLVSDLAQPWEFMVTSIEGVNIFRLRVHRGGQR
jgi:hypothetical protein